MTNRQLGGSMADAIEVANGDETLESIVISAYEVPRYGTERMQQRQIEDYKNEVYLTCAKAARNNTIPKF